MNRPRQYDREEVLAVITDLFWERGFEATSMNEVVARTKINKFSIYNEFGGKEKLFLASMDYYLRNSINFVEEILSKEPLGLTNIEAFFEYRLNHADFEKNNGCFIFNSVIEKESLSEGANLQVNAFILKFKALFYNCLHAAKARKEISNTKDCKALADYLSCFIFGLVNLGMKKMSSKELKESVDLALGVIKN